MSSISLSTQQYMISIVNTDCYKSPPVQTLALFAKLLTPAFEEMTVYVAAQHQFYSCLKAVKGLLMVVVFTHFELREVKAVPQAAYCPYTYLSKSVFPKHRTEIKPVLPLTFKIITRARSEEVKCHYYLHFPHSCASFREGNESCFWKIVIMTSQTKDAIC